VRRLSWFGFLLLALGCNGGDRSPHLIELTDVQPRHLETGDRMRLVGSGFPEGRPAKVTLRGEGRRAGEVSRDGVTVSVEAEQVAPHALEVPISAELAAKLCGGPTARHTTFRGDVEVSFSPQTESGLPVIGRLDGVVIDVVPASNDDAALRALRTDGARFARFLGMTLGAAPEGLQVTAVEAQGRAARANLSVGDVIQELDGVVVRGVADFIPPPNAKSSLMVLRRGPDSLAIRVDASGFRYSSPETLLPALFGFGVLLGTFLAVFSPCGRWLSLFERRLGERLREARLTTSVGKREIALWSAFKALLAHQLPESFLPYLALLLSCSLFSLLSLGKSVIWAELDVLLLPAVTLSGLCVAAFIAGGVAPWSLRRGLERACAVLLFNAPFALFIVATAWWSGSLRVSDVVSLQGAWPWQWAVFKNPLLGVLALASVLSRVATERVTPGLRKPSSDTARQRALSLGAWVHTLCVTGLIALLGLGGSKLPFSATSSFALGLGVALTLGKASLLVLTVGLFRWVFGTTDIVSSARAGLTWLLLPSLLALALGAGFVALGGGPTFGTLAQALPTTAFTCCFAVLGWVGWRVARGLRTRTAELRIQSWL
jgi:NADH-quinone oxidoreductase subunit H